MPRAVVPTDDQSEREKGRVPLWLDPDDLLWLSENWRAEDVRSDEERERRGRLQFRARAALHKAGLLGEQ